MTVRGLAWKPASVAGWQELGIASDCTVAAWVTFVNSFDSSDITKPMNKGKGSLQPVGKHQDAVLTARRSEFRRDCWEPSW